MALKHFDERWMNAEEDLVEAVAREFCARHGAQIFGYEKVTPEFVDIRWRSYECDARDAIAIVRDYDAVPK
jgi:hypothetical protein